MRPLKKKSSPIRMLKNKNHIIDFFFHSAENQLLKAIPTWLGELGRLQVVVVILVKMAWSLRLLMVQQPLRDDTPFSPGKSKECRTSLSSDFDIGTGLVWVFSPILWPPLGRGQSLRWQWVLCLCETYQFRQEDVIWLHCQSQGLSELEASLKVIWSRIFIL